MLKLTFHFTVYLQIFRDFCSTRIFRSSGSLFFSLLRRRDILSCSFARFYPAVKIRERFSIYEDDDRDGESTWSQGPLRVYGALMALAIAIFIERVTARY